MEGPGGGLAYPEVDYAEMDRQENVPYDYVNCTENLTLTGNYSYLCPSENETYYENINYPIGFKVSIAILYNSVFITALLGNALVCYVVFSSPRMRTVTNYLIANLAVGDLLMAILCVPFSYIPVLLQYWPFGHFLCYLLSPAQAISVLVSSYTLVALAADRYMAILYPLRPRLRRSQACWVIAVVWLIAIITATPIAIFTEYYPADDLSGHYYCEESGWRTMGVENFKLPYGLTLMILQYFFPLIVLIFTYSRIAMAVWGKKSLGEAEDSRDQRLAKTKRKMIKMMLTVVTVFFCSWTPINLFIIYGDIWPENLYYQNSRISSYVFPLILWLALAHTVWNPLIYCYLNSRFREGFRAAISNVPCLWKLFHFCTWRSRSGSIGHIIDISRRRSTNRLTRTNTTCTTYTFGSGSLHNLHNTGNYHNHHHPNTHHIFQNNPLMLQRKLSCQQSVNGNGRPSTGSISFVSPFPRGSHLSHHMSVPLSSSPEKVVKGRNGVNASTVISHTPARSSSPLETSPSSDSMVNLPMALLSPNTDLNGKGHHLMNGENGNGNVRNGSPTYVSVSTRGGKDQVITTTGCIDNGKVGTTIPSSILSQKRSSSSSGVSESFM